MSLAGDSIPVTPGLGEEIAVHTAGGKQHQVMMLAHSSGHIKGTIPTYYYWSTFDAGAANEVLIDLFNATGSGIVIKIRKLFVHHNQSVVTGVPFLYDVIKTSAVGTGGTVITGRPVDSANAAIPAQVTCRHAATGGATTNFTLFGFAVDTEETRPGTSIAAMINWMPEGEDVQEVVLREGEGLKVVQTTASTVGVMACLLVVTME
jgi:hypothetical protein